MIWMLVLGERLVYIKIYLVRLSLVSVVQGLKQIFKGLVYKGGDLRQIGGEFLFELVGGEDVVSLIKELGEWGRGERVGNGDGESVKMGVRYRVSEMLSIDGKNMELGGDGSEGVDKIVSWCYRMRNMRDYVEVLELMEVFGMVVGEMEKIFGDVKGLERERWERVIRERKGVGLGGKGRGSLER